MYPRLFFLITVIILSAITFLCCAWLVPKNQSDNKEDLSVWVKKYIYPNSNAKAMIKEVALVKMVDERTVCSWLADNYNSASPASWRKSVRKYGASPYVEHAIALISWKTGIPPSDIAAVGFLESSLHHYEDDGVTIKKRDRGGSLGWGQIQPATWNDVSPRWELCTGMNLDIKDPFDNIIATGVMLYVLRHQRDGLSVSYSRYITGNWKLTKPVGRGRVIPKTAARIASGA